MIKEDIMHIQNGLLFSHKKERNNGIYSNIGGTIYYHTNVEYKKDELMYKKEIDSQT